MKIFTRFFVFCILVLSILATPQTKLTFNNCILNFQNVTYFFYTSSVQKQISNEVHISNGNFEIVSCNANDACILKTKLTDILGESVRICNASTEQKFKTLDMYKNKIEKFESFDGYDIYYCYDSSLSRYINLEDKKVNIQIAIKNNQIDIGYPLILNGF